MILERARQLPDLGDQEITFLDVVLFEELVVVFPGQVRVVNVTLDLDPLEAAVIGHLNCSQAHHKATIEAVLPNIPYHEQNQSMKPDEEF
jgi:hypothetical protein